MLKNLALLAASLLGFLGLSEAALRALGYAAIYEEYSKPSLLWQHDELLGWSHTPDSSDTFVGPRPFPVEFRTPIHINSLGLRGPELRRDAEARVLLTGDSRVVSFEVPWQETFGARLETLLAARLAKPVEVVNAGVRGYGTDQSLLYYRERGRGLAPKLVIHLHSANDVGDNVTLHRMRRPFGKAAFRLDATGGLELVGVPVEPFPVCSELRMSPGYQIERVDSRAQRALCQLQILFFDHSALFTLVTSRIQRKPELLSWLYQLGAPEAAAPDAGGAAAVPSYDIELTNALLRAYAEEARGDGARFLLVGLRDLLDQLDTAPVTSAGGRIARLDEAFAGEESAIYFRNDNHYNAHGNRLIAEHLAPLAAELLDAGR